MSLKGKKILITAGPTWVPIDNVRVLSNIATGVTGIILAQKAAARGARVTLLLGPSSEVGVHLALCRGPFLRKAIRVIRFNFYSELANSLKSELSIRKYDIVIHSAAVADFRPEKTSKGKLDSSKRHNLSLVALKKIVKDIRRLAPKAKMVMFKLESGVTDAALIRIAKQKARDVRADLVVANRLNPYSAFIIDMKGAQTRARNKNELTKELLMALAVE